MISEIRSHLKQLLCIRFNLCPSHRTDVGLPLPLLDSCIVYPSRNVLIGGRIWRRKWLWMGRHLGRKGGARNQGSGCCTSRGYEQASPSLSHGCLLNEQTSVEA